MCSTTGLFLALALVSLVKRGLAQECVLQSVPDFSGASKHSRMLQRQLILPDYFFPCNTTVTQWEAQLHWHGRQQQLRELHFQVWRLDREQWEYRLAGSNSYSATGSDHHGQGVSFEGDRVVMNIENPEHVLSPMVGDIVGVYLEGEGVELQYKASKSVHMYLANLSGPQLEEFAAELEQSSVFEKDFKGAPLIRATTIQDNHDAISDEPLSTTLSPRTTTFTSTTLPGASGYETTPSDVTTSEKRITSEPNSIPAVWNLEHLVGGIAGGTMVVLLAIVCIILGAVIQRRRQRSPGPSSPTASSEFLRKSSVSEGTLLSHLQLDMKRRLKLFAFKRQESARNSEPKPANSGIKPRDAGEVNRGTGCPESPEETEQTIDAQDCIKMRTNLSYSALSSCTDSDPVASHTEYGYDTPLSVITVQPFEYELPLERSAQVQNEYETIPDLDVDDRVYEEVYSTIR